MYDYDVVVIGAGSAGLVACKLASGLGKKTLLIEKRKIGGDCTWFGCIPSKTLIKSAAIAHDISRLNDYGLEFEDGSPKLNADNVMAHVRNVVETDAAVHSAESYQQEGIDVIFGSPTFKSPHRIAVADKTITAKKFVICTGSHPFIPPIKGIEIADYLTNETIFSLDKLPRSMIVLGAGPIGIEMASALNRLGVEISVIVKYDLILPREDPELSERLMDILRAEGVKFYTHSRVNAVENFTQGIVATLSKEDGSEQSITAESLLVAVGRRPNLKGLALKKAGVEYNEKGVTVDKNLRTTAKNIYAAGDVVPPYLFTHIAEYEAVIATTNASFGINLKKTDYRNVLWCTFTAPELARAGLTEQQARERFGDNMRIYRWDHKDIDRAKTDLQDKGLTKVITRKDGKIIGIHILGHAAAELMHELQLAKVLGKPFSKVATMIHAYPSYSDAVRQPAKKCYIDLLQDNFFVKTIQTVTSKKNRKRLILLAIVFALFLALYLLLGDKISLENIQQNADRLYDFTNENYLSSVLVFIAVYIVSVAFNIPGAALLTLTAGFLYNTVVGALYVNVAATAGAACAFLFSRYIAGNTMQKKYADKLKTFNENIDRNGVSYMITLRLIPVIPFFLINIFAGLTNIPFLRFVWTTSVGILPGSLVYAYAGRQLRTIDSAADIMTPGVWIAFILLASLALAPIIIKKIRAFRNVRKKK